MATAATNPVVAARNKVATATKYHRPADEIAEARQDLTAAKLQRAIQEAIYAAPPLSPQRRQELAAMLAGGAR